MHIHLYVNNGRCTLYKTTACTTASSTTEIWKGAMDSFFRMHVISSHLYCGDFVFLASLISVAWDELENLRLRLLSSHRSAAAPNDDAVHVCEFEKVVDTKKKRWSRHMVYGLLWWY